MAENIYTFSLSLALRFKLAVSYLNFGDLALNSAVFVNLFREIIYRQANTLKRRFRVDRASIEIYRFSIGRIELLKFDIFLSYTLEIYIRGRNINYWQVVEK